MNGSRWNCMAVALLLATPVMAASPLTVHLVKDINTTPGNASSAPRDFRSIDGKVYFSAHTPETGRELFVTDGNAGTPQLVRDFASGGVSSNAMALGSANGKLITVATDSAGQTRVWSWNAATGQSVALVTLESGGWNQPQVTDVVALPGLLFFSRSRDGSLWVTDGTLPGTVNLTSTNGIPGIDHVMCVNGANVVVAARTVGDALMIWRSNGTAAGTTLLARVTDPTAGLPIGSAQIGGDCHFLVDAISRWSIWSTGGSAATTRLVASSSDRRALRLAALGGDLFVLELSMSESRVTRIAPATGAQQSIMTFNEALVWPYWLRVVDGRLTFTGPRHVGKYADAALYLSDGTAAGTELVTVEGAGPAWLYNTTLAPLGRLLLIRSPSTLWAFDPTSRSYTDVGGQFLFGELKDIAELSGVGFGAGEDNLGLEVWRFDGSATGTRRLYDLWSSTEAGVGGIAPWNSTVLDDGVLVFASAGDAPSTSAPRAVWRTDGSEAGTWSLPRPYYDNNGVTAVTRFGSDIAFVTNEPATGYRYYRADADLSAAVPLAHSIGRGDLQEITRDAGILLTCGYLQGTADLCAWRPGTAQPDVLMQSFSYGSGFSPLGQIGGVALFFGRYEQTGLWRSDGTAPGTFRLSPMVEFRRQFPGLGESALFHNKLYFYGCQNEQSCGLIVSDGTTAGTGLVAPLANSYVTSYAVLSDRFVFSVDAGSFAAEVWSSDGTPAGTHLLRSLRVTRQPQATAVGNMAHVVASCYDVCDNYLITDGRDTGTFPLTLPNGFVAEPSLLTALDNNNVVFACTSLATGTELCATTANGSETRLLRDIHVGPASSFPVLLRAVTEGAYLVADDGRHGYELWRVDVRGDLIFRAGFDL